MACQPASRPRQTASRPQTATAVQRMRRMPNACMRTGTSRILPHQYWYSCTRSSTSTTDVPSQVRVLDLVQLQQIQLGSYSCTTSQYRYQLGLHYRYYVLLHVVDLGVVPVRSALNPLFTRYFMLVRVPPVPVKKRVKPAFYQILHASQSTCEKAL